MPSKLTTIRLSKLAIATLLTTLSIGFNATAQTKDFYKDRERGWYWFEDPVNDEPIKETEQPKPQKSQAPKTIKPEQPDTIEIGVKWLRENLPDLRDKAIEDPTNPNNLKNFAYASRLMLDFGSRFSSEMSEFIKTESILDEERRRPTTAIGLAQFNINRNESLDALLEEMADKTHIWFFFRSDCQFCHRQIPVLKQLQDQTNIKVLAVSMDGLIIPGIESFKVVHDVGLQMSRELQVSATPTLFLVSNERKFRYPLTRGLETYDRLTTRIALAAKETGLIDEQRYNATKYVNEENVFKQNEGAIQADRKNLEEDPAYLSELLQKRLERRLNNRS